MGRSPVSRMIKLWAGLSILLVIVVACAQLSSTNLGNSSLPDTTNNPAYLSDITIMSGLDTLPSKTPEVLPALPQRSSPVHFERVVDEFANVLTAPSQVIQDQYGFIWIGSVDGLARYDGYHYKFFKHDLDDPNSLGSNQVTALFEDHTGTLWVGTDGAGLDQFNRAKGTFIHYRHRSDDPGSLGEGKVNVIYEDSLGRLWVGTSNGGLNRWERRSGTFVHYGNDPGNPGSLISNTVYAIFEDSRGSIWVGTNNGLDRLDSQTGFFTHFQNDPKNPDSLSHNSVYAIQEDPWSALWLGTFGGGLNRFDLESEKFVNFRFESKNPTSLSSDIITSLIVDRSGMLWIGTMGGGINCLDPKTNNFVRYIYNPDDPYGPSSNYINHLFEDRAAILWVSTARSLDKYDPYKVKFIHQFRRDHVTAIYEDRQDNLWVGAFDGLYKYEEAIDQVIHYRYDPKIAGSLSEWRVTDIVEDHYGVLWIGTNGGGLNRFDKPESSFTAYRYDPRSSNSLPSDVITTLYVDQQGNLWVGTDKGLLRFDGMGRRFIKLPLGTNQDGVEDDEIVSALLQDRQGKLWIGTEGGGLKRFEPDTGLMTTFRHNKDNPNSLHNNVIYALFEDTDGLLWVGTEGGLHRFDQQSETFTYFGVEHGLPDNEVYAILEDHNGNLWMSTDHGLSKFNPETGVFRNYDAEDGLQGDQFSGAALRRRTGEMLFGGMNGISAFSPDQISDNPYIPPIALLELRQDGQVMQIDQAVESLADLTMSGLARNFEFEFAALSYSQPERNQYAYLLEGYDTDWNYLGTERIGHYTDLPGGTYNLRLIGANDDGVWNEEGLSVRLTIAPPFWETRWFWGLLSVIVVGGAFAGYRIRVMSVVSRNRELEEQVLERTKESELRQKELEALYQADEVMHHHLNLNPLLQALVDVAVDILHADKSAVFSWSTPSTATQTGSKQLTMRVGRGIPPNCQAFQLEIGEWLVDLKEPVFVTDAQQESHADSVNQTIARLMMEQGIYSWIFLPIHIQDEFFGVFSVCYTRPQVFGERLLRLFQALVQRASLAIENACLYENAQELAVIKERNRLARDLHDSVKQKTFAALAQIGASRRLIDSQPERAQGYMEEAENLVHDVLTELVTLIKEMYPLNLHERGLEQTLRPYALQWSRQTGIQVDFSAYRVEYFPQKYAQTFYRVFQEALANVARHSRADRVEIIIGCNDDGQGPGSDGQPVIQLPGTVYLRVTDNGCGFDMANIQPGMGLRSMRERVENLGGVLYITSRPGEGTSVEVILPGAPEVISQEAVLTDLTECTVN